MGVVVIESFVWEPSSTIFVFFFVSTFLSIFLFPFFSKNRTFSSFDSHTVSSSFARFQRWFLAIYTLSSVMEGLWLVYGESELGSYGLSKESIVFYVSVCYSINIILGPLLGVLSDLIGQKRICILFSFLHLVVGVWKRITMSPSALFANLCLSLAGLIYSFGFETWLVLEHETKSQRNDSLNETFWLMTFLESASLIGGQALANWLVGYENVQHGIALSATASVFLSAVAIICIVRTAKEPLKTLSLRDYSAAFYAYVLGDKRIWFLGTSQACLQFSTAVFWILWAPTIVADGREVNLGSIYPCFLGSRMLGSTVFPWLMSGQSFRLEDCLVYIYAILGIVFSIVAYDYQEIGILVVLFCLFHGCSGLILPLLARFRSMYVPNELRGGMISLSQVPANAAILFCLIQRGYSHKIENSTMVFLGAISLFIASGCIFLLRRCGKSPHQDWHKL